ncbi:MAG: tyrosine-type recombinase/integrase [Treponemataceae bacterium]
MKNALPFSVFKKGKLKSFYVQFKDKETNKYLNQISTGQTDEKKAIQTAWDWYYHGIPNKKNELQPLENKSLIENIRKTDISILETEAIIKDLQSRGLIKSAVITGSRQDKPLDSFLLNFWDFEKSPYIQEKLRKQHSIHKRYCKTNHMYTRLYWVKFFKDRVLGSLTRLDIENFITYLTEKNLSSSAKNHIIKAGMVALKWAYQRELIDRDLYNGITYFAGSKTERQILTPELAQALFSVEWDSKHAELANKLSMVTGLRVGEILALRIQDLGNDCLYIRHSYNDVDGLKVTKNTESRIVELPFKNIIVTASENNKASYCTTERVS